MARIRPAPDVAVGEHWAYRARLADPLVEVIVIRLGVKAPRRVLVRWADDAFEGQQDWVPPARLKAPWPQVEAFQEHERRWDEAVAMADGYPESVREAVGMVFDLLVDERLARLGWNAEAGIIRVRDEAALAASLRVEPDALTHDAAFVDDGELILPMPTAMLIARRAAERDPDAVLRYVEHEEADARREAVHGRYYPARGRNSGFSVSAEECRADDEARDAPVRAVLREWAGAEPAGRRAEVAAAREEAARLAAIATAALDALRNSGHTRTANRIERELGPVRQ
jgi:hypothetical protein